MTKKSIIWIIIILLFALAVIVAVKTILGNEKQATFSATVLENMGTSIMVKPDDGENELRSSDKIVVRVPKDGAVLQDLSQFLVDSKVKITYSGEIMESYPAQINATKVELIE